MWRYTDQSDKMRLCTDNFIEEVLDSVMGTLFTTAAIPAPTEDARPLFRFTKESVREHLATLPRFDEWGIMPKGHSRSRDNPRAAHLEEIAEPPGSSESSDSSEGDASRVADPSTGLESSSRNAQPEGDLQEISSGSDEDPFHTAPSQRVEEEEESDGEQGRRNLRSKAAHDRPAEASESAPGEEAQATREGAGASGPQPRKVKKRMWTSLRE